MGNSHQSLRNGSQMFADVRQGKKRSGQQQRANSPSFSFRWSFDSQKYGTGTALSQKARGSIRITKVGTTRILLVTGGRRGCAFNFMISMSFPIY
mmetsp:Transcript_33795/g.77966  ORF Transcript_33795/g.77966 Transcript_33795/m.77966 type:complete len:95 (+) Transcript_33795:103-387(+)